jgi:hypothetical protein
MKLSFGHLKRNQDILSAREWSIKINGKLEMLAQDLYVLYEGGGTDKSLAL